MGLGGAPQPLLPPPHFYSFYFFPYFFPFQKPKPSRSSAAVPGEERQGGGTRGVPEAPSPPRGSPGGAEGGARPSPPQKKNPHPPRGQRPPGARGSSLPSRPPHGGHRGGTEGSWGGDPQPWEPPSCVCVCGGGRQDPPSPLAIPLHPGAVPGGHGRIWRLLAGSARTPAPSRPAVTVAGHPGGSGSPGVGGSPGGLGSPRWVGVRPRAAGLQLAARPRIELQSWAKPRCRVRSCKHPAKRQRPAAAEGEETPPDRKSVV